MTQTPMPILSPNLGYAKHLAMLDNLREHCQPGDQVYILDPKDPDNSENCIWDGQKLIPLD